MRSLNRNPRDRKKVAFTELRFDNCVYDRSSLTDRKIKNEQDLPPSCLTLRACEMHFAGAKLSE